MRIFIFMFALCSFNVSGENMMDSNSPLVGLAYTFAEDSKRDTLGVSAELQAKLDYSVESSVALEVYLKSLPSFEGFNEELTGVLLRSGAYLGEVIRRNQKHGQYNWYSYDQALSIKPELAKFGKDITTAAVLIEQHGAVVFPIDKALKIVRNPQESSLLFYTQLQVGIDPTKSLSEQAK